MALWGGRFREQSDEFFARFSSSFGYDRRLLPYDLEGSRAWAFALARIGILSLADAQQIARGLRSIRRQAMSDPEWLDQYPEEDVHTFVEARLYETIGEPALRLHSGRSRNDQIALDLRMYVREITATVARRLADLGFELLRLAERHPDTPLPGYTHLRRAQPVLLAHFLLAYVEMLLRDIDRLRDVRRRADVLPLGSGALAGAAYPVDRERLARRLGFREVTDNSLDAVSDRDFVVELLATGALIGSHLSRLSEDLILYSTTEFGYLEISDEMSTGSSLMPQKKNPDSLELVRGKSGRLQGNLNALLTTLKGLPLAYNRDLQEDKEPLFDTVDTLLSCLQVIQTVIAGLQVREERCRIAAAGDFSTATDLADYLVRKGEPFRQAHHVVGRVVLACLENGLTLEELPLEAYQEISEVFEDDLYEAIGVEKSLEARAVRGGTAPIVVSVALGRAHKRLRQTF